MARAAVTQRSESRARELRDALRALRREQGLIIAELVWNEMRAWEIRGLLEGPARLDDTRRGELERDLAKRCTLIRSLAQWERSADTDYQRLRRRLLELGERQPACLDELEDAAELLGKPGLTVIARAAAQELGLDLDGGVDGL